MSADLASNPKKSSRPPPSARNGISDAQELESSSAGGESSPARKAPPSARQALVSESVEASPSTTTPFCDDSIVSADRAAEAPASPPERDAGAGSVALSAPAEAAAAAAVVAASAAPVSGTAAPLDRASSDRPARKTLPSSRRQQRQQDVPQTSDTSSEVAELVGNTIVNQSAKNAISLLPPTRKPPASRKSAPAVHASGPGSAQTVVSEVGFASETSGVVAAPTFAPDSATSAATLASPPGALAASPPPNNALAAASALASMPKELVPQTAPFVARKQPATAALLATLEASTPSAAAVSLDVDPSRPAFSNISPPCETTNDSQSQLQQAAEEPQAPSRLKKLLPPPRPIRPEPAALLADEGNSILPAESPPALAVVAPSASVTHDTMLAENEAPSTDALPADNPPAVLRAEVVLAEARSEIPALEVSPEVPLADTCGPVESSIAAISRAELPAGWFRIHSSEGSYFGRADGDSAWVLVIEVAAGGPWRDCETQAELNERPSGAGIVVVGLDGARLIEDLSTSTAVLLTQREEPIGDGPLCASPEQPLIAQPHSEVASCARRAPRALAPRRVMLASAVEALMSSGIDVKRADVQAELKELTLHCGELVQVDVDAALARPGGLVGKALTGNLAVRDFPALSASMLEAFEAVAAEPPSGKCASYIPILAGANPALFAAAVCTVDGQRWQVGDTEHVFSIQSCVKPLVYAAAVEDRSLDVVHRLGPGFEPSGHAFNDALMDDGKQPFNPFINSGAIVTGALVGPGLAASARFGYLMQLVRRLSCDASVGYSHETFLCEQETAWRNNALVALMRDAGIFAPERGIGTGEAALEFYLQSCSIELNVNAAAAIAASLASGGVSPLSRERVLQPATVKAVASLMLSCGMYDASGAWIASVGLPAKSGVAGLIYVVVPGVMGMAVFSPPLDAQGNSARGVDFCRRLQSSKAFPQGIFEQIVRRVRPLRSIAATTGGDRQRVSGNGLAALLRVMLRVRRLLRTIRRVRLWCGLPVSENDLRRLAGALGAEEFPEINLALVRVGAGGAFSRDILGEGEAMIRRYALYRSLQHNSDLSLAAQLVPSRVSAPAAALRRFFEVQGLSILGTMNPRASSMWTSLLSEAGSEASSSIRADQLMPRSCPPEAAESNVLVASLCGRLGAPHFAAFCASITEAFNASSAEALPEAGLAENRVAQEAIAGSQHAASSPPLRSSPWKHAVAAASAVPPESAFLSPRSLSSQNFGCGSPRETVFPSLLDSSPDAFGVAVCTVSGQTYSIGDAASPFVLAGAVRPLLYALACLDCGVSDVESWVGAEPTSAPADTFSLLPASSQSPHPRPINPCLDAGAVVIASLLGRLYKDNGSRFAHVLSSLRRWSGGRRVGFSNTTFLEQKEARLRTLATAFYCKGAGCFPSTADPTVATNFLLQAEAATMTAETLAVVAATLANVGVVPTTGERCLPEDVVKTTLSQMFVAGIGRGSGRYMFEVGVPSAGGASGCVVAVIPGCAGIVAYSPRLGSDGVSARGAQFFRLLSRRLRLHLFDHLF